MATAKQIKELVKSHLSEDREKFITTVLQLAAKEAKKGHKNFAQELKSLVEEAKKEHNKKRKVDPVPIARPEGELSDLLTASYPKIRLSGMVLTQDVQKSLKRILKEQRKGSKIKAEGLRPRHKFLLTGPPGTGKTMTASVLAGELGIPLFTVRLDGLLTKYMGETTSKLKVIFDEMKRTRGVYLFDEFDSIGADRGLLNDVGEIRRVLNSFLIYLEQDDSNSLIIAATNFEENLDYALYRRFDDIIEYERPGRSQRVELLRKKLSGFDLDNLDLETLAEETDGFSYADLTRLCEESYKKQIIQGKDSIYTDDVLDSIHELNLIPD